MAYCQSRKRQVEAHKELEDAEMELQVAEYSLRAFDDGMDCPGFRHGRCERRNAFVGLDLEYVRACTKRRAARERLRLAIEQRATALKNLNAVDQEERNLTAAMLMKELGIAKEEMELCGICWETLLGDTTKLDCGYGHEFHSKCLREMIESDNGRKTLHCPTCKGTAVRADGECRTWEPTLRLLW